jgi:hypothetical protein
VIRVGRVHGVVLILARAMPSAGHVRRRLVNPGDAVELAAKLAGIALWGEAMTGPVNVAMELCRCPCSLTFR